MNTHSWSPQQQRRSPEVKGFAKLSSKSSMMRFIDGNHKETTLNEKVSPDWCK